MAYQQLIFFTSCCQNAQFIFLSLEIPGLPSGHYVYTGTSTIIIILTPICMYVYHEYIHIYKYLHVYNKYTYTQLII